MQENTIENRENHMEKHDETRPRGKKKFGLIGMSTRGGGIEKVVAVGGALAVAGLIAVFSIKKSDRKDSNKNKDMKMSNVSAKEEDAGEGLSLILHQNSCCKNQGTSELGVITEIETSELVSNQSLITLKENTIECEMKDSAVHDAEQESGDHGEKKNNPMKSSNAIANLEVETFEITVVDKAVDVDAEENPTLQSLISTEDDDDENEEYSPMRSSFSIEDDPIGEVDNSPKESQFSTEEEEEEDEVGENVSEILDEEGTWSSSPEPNMEVIWPAEMVEMNVSNHLESAMKSNEEDITMAKISTYHYMARTKFDGKNNKKETEEVVVMDVRKQQHSAKRHSWVWFGLVVLMLVCLANCLLQSNYLSDNPFRR